MTNDERKAALEYEQLGYERRLAGAVEAGDEKLADAMKERIKSVRAALGGKQTTAREPGERAVEAAPEKRG